MAMPLPMRIENGHEAQYDIPGSCLRLEVDVRELVDDQKRCAMSLTATAVATVAGLMALFVGEYAAAAVCGVLAFLWPLPGVTRWL
jgi:hypothetical protein